MLVANKIDLPNRIISTEKGAELAEAHNLAFFETSAKTGANINELFFDIASKIVKDRPVAAPSDKKSHGYAAYQSSATGA